MIFAQSVFSVHRILEDMQEFKICYQKKKCSNEPPIGKRIAVLFVKLVLTINILILYLKQHRTLRMYRIKQITLYI